MLSDHELSVLVAEKVYGLGFVPDLWRPDNHPSFATDQGLALDAALKGYNVVTIEHIGEGPRALVQLSKRRGMDATDRWWATGSTVARALCLASLRASGVEVEDDHD